MQDILASLDMARRGSRRASLRLGDLTSSPSRNTGLFSAAIARYRPVN